ncbi:MAG: endonuclease III domain-containing protein [Bellilinea sp.]
MSIYPSHIYEIAQALENKYRNFNHYNRSNPLDELIFIICSLKTQEYSYRSTFKAIKRAFPKFTTLASATAEEIEKVIKRGGLEKQKSKTISFLMQDITEKFGHPTLSTLKKMSDENCEKTLVSFRGVGLKSARCVMMYSLNRKVFPVDSHVWRITKRLGWNPSPREYRSSTDKEMDVLQEMVPPDLRYSLHVNFVSLGREICLSRKPKCDECPIQSFCPKIGL